MYLVYKKKEYPIIAFCTVSNNWVTKPSVSIALKELSLRKTNGDIAKFEFILNHVNKNNYKLVNVYDDSLKEIPVTTFTNDNPELFI
jgi:hypothetical protein